MLQFFDFLVIGGIFCSFLICAVLVFKSQSNAYLKCLLALALFCVAWYSQIYLLLVTKVILQYPAIYGWGLPLYYLVPPVCYLYVNGLIKDEKRLSKINLLHGLPAFITFAGMVPFYLLPATDKYTLISAIVNDLNRMPLHSTGIIPNLWHFIMRPAQGLAYMLAIWVILSKQLFKKNKILWKMWTSQERWLFIFSLLMTGIYCGLAFMTAAGINGMASGQSVLLIIRTPAICLAVSFFVLSIYLFFNPDLLYGAKKEEHSDLPEEESLVDAEKEPGLPMDKKTESISEAQIMLYARQVEEFFIEKHPYRRQGLSIAEVSAETGIPAKTLSFVLNDHYKQRFTDFVNSYRLEYIKRRLDENSWRGLTLEGLALEAGFASRSTFFTAFKKYTGQSPTEYLKSVQEVTVGDQG